MIETSQIRDDTVRMIRPMSASIVNEATNDTENGKIELTKLAVLDRIFPSNFTPSLANLLLSALLPLLPLIGPIHVDSDDVESESR